jgi:hypothetical protein
LVACGGNTKPAVIPKLSELPADPDRRDAVLDSAHAEPTPEQHGPTTPKQRKVETAAATAAAVIGWLASSHENVALGVGTGVDEGDLGPKQPVARPRADGGDANTDDVEAVRAHEKRHHKDDPQGNVDVPWVRLK